MNTAQARKPLLHLPASQIVSRDGWTRVQTTITLEATASTPAHTRDLFIAVLDEFASILNADSAGFLPACMMHAMKHGYDVVTDTPVDARAMRGLAELQRAYQCIHPTKINFTHIQYPDTRREPVPAGRGKALFFSGGVDAFHAAMTVASDPLLKPGSGEVCHLIAIQGFDSPLSDGSVFGNILAAATSVSKQTGWPVVPTQCNLKEVFYPLEDRCRGWSEFGFVACMMSIAYAMDKAVDTMYLASGFGYREAPKDGSHPAYDHLWSNERQEIINVGSAASRLDKLEALAPWADCLATLRVCGHVGKPTPVNCGQCDKCRRTILALHALGLLDHALPTFPRQALVNLHDVARRVSIPGEFQRNLYVQIAQRLRKNPGDQTLAKVLESSIRRSRKPLLLKLEKHRRQLVELFPRALGKLKRMLRKPDPAPASARAGKL